MSQPLTADDILPLVAQLTPAERLRLFRLIQAASNDAEAYRVAPPAQNEFSSDEELPSHTLRSAESAPPDVLAWDGEGWENVK